jgi:hypothetical protein
MVGRRTTNPQHGRRCRRWECPESRASVQLESEGRLEVFSHVYPSLAGSFILLLGHWLPWCNKRNSSLQYQANSQIYSMSQPFVIQRGSAALGKATLATPFSSRQLSPSNARFCCPILLFDKHSASSNAFIPLASPSPDPQQREGRPNASRLQ